MNRTCQAPNCGAPTPDSTLCHLHTQRLYRTVAGMPDRLTDLQDTAAGLARTAPRHGRAPVDPDVWTEADDPAYLTDVTLVATPSPVVWGAANLLTEAHRRLRAWAQYTADRAGLDVCVTDPTGFLHAAAQHLALDVDAGRAYDELTWLSTAVQKAVDRGPEMRLVGKCDADAFTFRAEGDKLVAVRVDCGGPLYAEDGAATATCALCGATYTDLTERRTAALDRIDDQWRTADVIAEGLTNMDLPVAAGTIRVWASRAAARRRKGMRPLANEVHQVGVDDRGRPVYRVGDVRARLEAVRVAREGSVALRSATMRTPVRMTA